MSGLDCMDRTIPGSTTDWLQKWAMKMAEPLTKLDRSQVAPSIEVTVPGTRNWNHSHTHRKFELQL